MPLEIDLPDDDEQLSLEEYVERLEQQHYDLSDQNDLIASAPYLKKLGNNKDFLIDQMFNELKDCLQFQEANIYAPEVLILHRTNDYFIRANIWKPVTKVEEQVPGYRYDVCHDHNFDILTIGYLGPGYQCRAYTYDSNACIGILGEKVDLRTERLFTLSEGKVALYRAKRDVHIQLPPERISVSINLIPKGAARNEPQLQFDESSGRITRYLNFSGTEAVLRLAGLVGSHEYLDVLARIADQHPNPKIRALALVAQMRIAAERTDAIQANINGSQPPLVRHIVESEMTSYGSCLKTVDIEPEESYLQS
ncbi:MAG TPA: hypothetical protein VJ728_06350 [Candidatus Binataceae bacterium]|nr:hypothetical protein [Candidatus Binataceae bacterium]